MLQAFVVHRVLFKHFGKCRNRAALASVVTT